MKDTFLEMFEFAGKATGTIVKDLADVSQPLTEAFRRGWREAMAERPTAEPAPSPSPSNHASKSPEHL